MTYQRQRGAALLVGMLILIIVTIMTVFAVNIGIFEQRASGNEYRAKQSFHYAEAAMGAGLEYLKSNSRNLTDAGYDATDSLGWFDEDNTTESWQECPGTPPDGHPCSYASDAMNDFGGLLYFYQNDADNSYFLNVPTTGGASFNMGPNNDIPPRVMALMCIRPENFNDCVEYDSSEASDRLVVQLIGFGASDDATGSSVVSQIIAPFKMINSTIAAPIVTAGTFTGSGTLDIVTNPNGGGPGTPLSIWSAADATLGKNGAARTCQKDEWKRTGTPVLYNGILTCDNCGCPSDKSRILSGKEVWAATNADGIDILDTDSGNGPTPDTTNFPADLFEYAFFASKDNYEKVKDRATQVLADCSTLDSNSSGLIWVEGVCSIGSDVSQPKVPMVLVVAGPELRINAQGRVFGLIFVTNAVTKAAVTNIKLNGGPEVYGAIMADHPVDMGNGNIQIVYDGEVLRRASQDPDFSPWGPIPGTWNDHVLQ